MIAEKLDDLSRAIVESLEAGQKNVTELILSVEGSREEVKMRINELFRGEYICWRGDVLVRGEKELPDES